ncbi:MAG: insulinase family protein [Planctomycetes bacterium]|nr:insulinase family protein [Planctomycetota bacterium]
MAVKDISERLINFDIGEALKIRLENGLTLILKPISIFPITYIRTFAEVTSADDPKDRSGLAHITGSMFDEGIKTPTKEWDYNKIADFVESKGSVIQTHTNGIAIKTLSRYVVDMLEICRDVLVYSSFPEERLQKIKNDTITEIRSRKDDPRHELMNVFRENVYYGTPLTSPDIGYESSVASISRDEVIGFYLRFYRPENTTIVIAGDFNQAEVLGCIRKYFMDWKVEGEFHPNSYSFVPVPPKQLVMIKKQTFQSNIIFGHVGTTRENPDFYKLRVLETILGRGPLFYDRLSSQIREKNGLAYEVWGVLTRDADKFPGTVAIYIGTENKNRDKALQMAKDIVADFAANGPTLQELEGSKEYVLRSLFSQWETIEGYAYYLLNVVRFNKQFDFYREIARSVSELDLETARRLSGEYLRPDELITVIAGPE